MNIDGCAAIAVYRAEMSGCPLPTQQSAATIT